MRRYMLLILLFPGVILAWGDTGHETICQMTFDRLNTAARNEVVRLINLDPNFITFAESCVWPDHPRRRRPEHFINVPRSYAALAASNGCNWPTPVLRRTVFPAV